MSNTHKEEIYKHHEHMVMEYSILSYDEKVKYMNNLTEWYMREKGIECKKCFLIWKPEMDANL